MNLNMNMNTNINIEYGLQLDVRTIQSQKSSHEKVDQEKIVPRQ